MPMTCLCFLKPLSLLACTAALGFGVGCSSGIAAGNDSMGRALGKPSPVVALFDEEILASNGTAIRRRTAMMSDADRFDGLLQWVLPSETHSTIRMSGEFADRDPIPTIHGVENSADTHGGVLVSPVFDLLDLAAKTNRMPELLNIVNALPVSSSAEQQRARVALLLLIQLELKQKDAAAETAQELLNLVMQYTPEKMAEQWAETLVVYRAILKTGNHAIVNDLIAHLHSQRAQRELPKGCRAWHNQIASLAGRQAVFATGGTAQEIQPSAGLSQWVSVSRTSATTRGTGHSSASWRRREDRVDNVTSHDDEYLFFRSPLSGDYEVECDLTAPNAGRSQVMVAGAFAGPRYDRKQLEVGTFRSSGTFEAFDFPQVQFGPWVHYRAVVRDKQCRVYIDGLPVRTLPITEYSDPWVAIRSWGRSRGGVRNLRITGNPVIPDQISLSGAPDLVGWMSYFHETVASKGAHWEHVADPDSIGMITGRRSDILAGTFAESLLRYQRPLEENGSIDYDFFYSPGRIEVHPALDQIAFLLHADGVRTHRITNGSLDSSDAAPDSISSDSDGEQHQKKLPLKADAWNHMTVTMNGSMVALQLNGELAFQQRLDDSNDRRFGLFHYADATEVQVRNVTMRGDWPMTLPTLSDQELAQPLTNQLNADLAKLKTVFTHDFTTRGLPPEFFTTTDSDQRGAQLVGDHGIAVTRPTTGNWSTSDIRLPFALHGDFDVEASFEQLHVTGDKDGCIMLNVHLDDEKQHEVRLMRIRNTTQRQLVQVSISSLQQDNVRSYNTRSQVSCEAFQGRLRIARRNNTIHFLFAENDSAAWQIIGTETITSDTRETRPTKIDAVRLQTMGNGIGQIQVVWKNVTVRAERLTKVPAGTSVQRSLYMMQADGTDLHAVTPPTLGFTHLGSTEWSLDNRKLICDMSTGGTDASHIVLMNQDGTNMKDLGLGCMPSLSPDGLQIVCSDPREGIVRMKADGSDREPIERNGWGTQWSPDGRTIAWGNGTQIVLLDVKTNRRRDFLTPAQSAMLGSVYWNLGWSPDSQWIAFKARRATGNDGMVVVANVESPDEFKILYEGPNRINEDFTWHPANAHVVCAMRLPGHNKLRLVKISREHPAVPEILPGQPADWDVLDCDWSPDGKHIVFAAMAPPEPIDWSVQADSRL
jgi:WD40 repeat protein